MKNIGNQIRFTIIILFFIVIGSIGCNKTTFIENIGLTEKNLANSEDISTLLLSCQGATNRCGDLTLSLDGNEIGVLKQDFRENYNCASPPIENKFIKIVVSAGHHVLHISTSGKCKKFDDVPFEIVKGDCKSYTIL